MTTEYVGALDTSKIHFMPVQHDPNNSRTKVDVYRNAESTTNRNRIEVQLCQDASAELIETKFGLDMVRPGEGDPNRRGLALKIKDKDTLDALHRLDEKIIATAVEHSKEWFKKVCKEDEIRLRYKPLVTKMRDEDDHETMKVKVKVGDSPVPTAMHLREPDGTVRENGATVEHIEKGGAKVAPIVSSTGLWFMGGTSFGMSFQVEKMIVVPAPKRNMLDGFVTSKPFKVARTESPPAGAAGDEPVNIEVQLEDGEVTGDDGPDGNYVAM